MLFAALRAYVLGRLIKSALTRYVRENFDDLLALDLKIARLLGAPAPHTLSSYAYELEQKGRIAGKVFRPFIDLLFSKDHCKRDYEKRILGI